MIPCIVQTYFKLSYTLSCLMCYDMVELIGLVDYVVDAIDHFV